MEKLLLFILALFKILNIWLFHVVYRVHLKLFPWKKILNQGLENDFALVFLLEQKIKIQ